MREILFRGKRIDNGEWVYGFYSKHSTGKTFIRVTGKPCTGSYEVDPSTVGQYTGLTDKNDKIISVSDDSERVTAVIYGSGLFGVKHADHSIPSIIPLRAYDVYSQIEVIGNIHDNSELLEDKPS